MAMRVYNKRNNTLQNNEPVLPAPSSLEYGELSINYAAGHETIAIKNDNNEIVTFSPGKQGPQGPQGEQGEVGVQGPQGADGTSGEEGKQGPEGPQGAEGPQGPQGADGTSGDEGKQGPEGPQGADGAQGPQGADGTNGEEGKQGPQGPEGPSTIPTIGPGDEGKVLKVVNGVWALVTPINVYSGSGTPPASVGIDGDLYLQTS